MLLLIHLNYEKKNFVGNIFFFFSLFSPLPWHRASAFLSGHGGPGFETGSIHNFFSVFSGKYLKDIRKFKKKMDQQTVTTVVELLHRQQQSLSALVDRARAMIEEVRKTSEVMANSVRATEEAHRQTLETLRTMIQNLSSSSVVPVPLSSQRVTCEGCGNSYIQKNIARHMDTCSNIRRRLAAVRPPEIDELEELELPAQPFEINHPVIEAAAAPKREAPVEEVIYLPRRKKNKKTKKT